MRELYQRFLIAESERMNYDYYVKGLGFAAFIQDVIRHFHLTDSQIVEAGSLLEGISFREQPEDPRQALTLERYFELVGRPELH